MGRVEGNSIPGRGGGCVFPWCRASGRAGRMAVGGPAEETLESHHETVLSFLWPLHLPTLSLLLPPSLSFFLLPSSLSLSHLPPPPPLPSGAHDKWLPLAPSKSHSPHLHGNHCPLTTLASYTATGPAAAPGRPGEVTNHQLHPALLSWWLASHGAAPAGRGWQGGRRR